MRPSLDEFALHDWIAAVGAEYVVTQDSALEEAETATFATAARIPAIVRPANREEVQHCVRIANRRRIALYPISSGRNWGYGSRVPTSDGSVLLDLSRMNRILDFNEHLGYVTVEPGVTQAQLFDFLRERRSNLWMDCTGASPQCSLIGNTMERGFGHTPYGDHFAHSCGLEVVLPEGQVIETGFARYPGANAAALYRWGVGPSIDGLFSQSNLGIVTRMTIWLMPAPEYFQAYYFRSETEEGLGPIVEALRPLRMNGTIRSSSHIGNDYKVLSALQQYPWERTEGRTPLGGADMARFRGELKIGVWNGSGALYGTKAQVAEARRLLRIALKNKANKLEFLDDRKLRLAARFASVYQKLSGWDLKRTLAVLKPVYGLMKGVPTDHPLFSTYWRKRTPPPAQMNPDRDGCGLLWCSPIAPNTGADALRVNEISKQCILSHGFEPVISLTVLTDRTLSCIVSITYDRALPGEDAKASACYSDLLTVLARQGYYSYRLGINGMQAMDEGNAYGDTLRRLKDALDPNGVLAPGRYSSVSARETSRLKETQFAGREFAASASLPTTD
jgi:4-cresol dehydrogenase (hydroxylating) flavoprotein subunit